MDRYLATLAEANRSLNLISFSDDKELRGHAVDSLQALRCPPRGPALTVADVGTGGGLPGAPIALARPNWRVVPIDTVRKKQATVAAMAGAGGIENLTALWARAEDLARQPDRRESFDVALCRAVGRFSTVLELTLPLVRLGGACLLHRGSEGPAEAASAGEALARLGGRLGCVTPYRLPGLDRERFIICIEKTSQTGDAYPRRPGIPAKRPL
jgi:16S rRNA (guanine527-N7)-methyltransferase